VKCSEMHWCCPHKKTLAIFFVFLKGYCAIFTSIVADLIFAIMLPENYSVKF
jgi:hypothetical protein